MSISYSHAMATEMAVGHVVAQLCDVARSVGLFDALVTPELVIEEGAVTTRGLWIRVGEKRTPSWHPVITDLGFTPTVFAVFALPRWTEPSDSQDDMIRLVSGLLDRVPGDAVLHFQFEVIWLLRRGTELSLNPRDDLWPPRRLAGISQPYRRAEYAFAEE